MEMSKAFFFFFEEILNAKAESKKSVIMSDVRDLLSLTEFFCFEMILIDFELNEMS